MSRYAAAIHENLDADLAVHAFVDVQAPRLSVALAALPAEALIVVIPLLLSRGVHVGRDLPGAVEPYSHRAVIAAPLGPDAHLSEVLVERLAEAGHCSDEPVVLAVAGSSDPAGIDDARRAGALLGKVWAGAIAVGFVSSATPSVDDAVKHARHLHPTGERLAISSYMLAPGYFHGLLATAGADRTTEPLLRAEGPPHGRLIDVALRRYWSARSAFD